MQRRDFLLLRREEEKKVADLSCEKLFIHYEGLQSGFHQAEEEAGSFDDAEWWAGEPPLLISNMDPEEFFRSLQSDLKDVDILQVLDMEWLAQGDFRIRVETLLAALRAQGSEVNYGAKPQELSESQAQEQSSII